MFYSPLVTVLMPVYNAEKYLRTAIFSILIQTFKNFEFIIINDASTDDSEGIILSFTDKRIKYYKNKKNIGIIGSLNKGITLATGKYIARMDADDISHPEILMRQVNFLEANESYGLIGSWYYVIDHNSALKNLVRKKTDDKDIRLAMVFQNQFVHPGVMMRTAVLRELKYDSEMIACEDYDLWMRFLNKTKVANLPDMLLTYRWHGYNISIIKQKDLLETILKIHSRTLDQYHIKHTSEELFIHAIISFGYGKKYFSKVERFNELNNWLNKLQDSRKLCQRFGNASVKQVLNIIRSSTLHES